MTIVAPTWINGERWLSWKQGGIEFLVKAYTVSRIDVLTPSTIVVHCHGGKLRIDTSLDMFRAAMEVEKPE